MPETRTVQINIKGAQTEAGCQRIMAAAAKRDQVDYDCYQVLRELADNEMLTTKALRRALQAEVGMGVTAQEADDCAEEWAEQVREVLQKRRDADQAFTVALRTQCEE